MDDVTASHLPEGFRSLRVLGSGENAVVHHAVQDLSGLEVALKVWRRPTAGFSAVQKQHFQAQVSLLSRMTPADHVVEYRWSGLPEDGHPWLATALYECSLGDRVAAGRLDLVELLDIADDLLTGLAALHREGFVHRDVSPSNVLLRGHDAVLSDLGLAMPCEPSARVDPAGTWGFVAPEAGFGGHVDRRSDVFAAARTIRAVSPFATPVWLQTALADALSEDPSRRPADADEFRRLLTNARTEAGLPRVVPVAAGFPRSRRHPARGALVVVSTAIVAAVSLTVAITGAATPVAEARSRSTPSSTSSAASSQPALTGTPALPSPSTAVPIVASGLRTGAPLVPGSSSEAGSSPAVTVITTITATDPDTTGADDVTRVPIPLPTSDPITSPPGSSSSTTDAEPKGEVVVPTTRELVDEAGCNYQAAEHEVTGTTAKTSTDIRMDRAGTYGYAHDGGITVGYAASYTGTAPSSGALYSFVRAEKGQRSDGGDEGNGVIYRGQEIHPHEGCSFLEDTLTENDADIGLIWTVFLAYVPDSALDAVRQSENNGWASWAEAPAGLEPLSWFTMDTDSFTRASQE